MRKETSSMVFPAPHAALRAVLHVCCGTCSGVGSNSWRPYGRVASRILPAQPVNCCLWPEASPRHIWSPLVLPPSIVLGILVFSKDPHFLMMRLK